MTNVMFLRRRPGARRYFQFSGGIVTLLSHAYAMNYEVSFSARAQVQVLAREFVLRLMMCLAFSNTVSC